MAASVPFRWEAWVGLLLVLCLSGAWLIEADLDRRNLTREEEEKTYLIPAERMRPLLMGYDLVAADFFWLEAVQYAGKHLQESGGFPALYPRLVRVVSLDPFFLDAYRIGGILLAYSAGQVDNAIRLLVRGVAVNPNRWELPHDLGILHYLLKKDYPEALRWLERANRLPGRPEYVPRFVARLYASTGQRETAIEMWMRVYEQTDLEGIRAMARRELRSLGIHLPPEGAR